MRIKSDCDQPETIEEFKSVKFYEPNNLMILGSIDNQTFEEFFGIVKAFERAKEKIEKQIQDLRTQYKSISEGLVAVINSEVNDITTKLLELENELIEDSSINLHICSIGGEINAMSGIIAVISNSSIIFNSIITGEAASAAAVISIICDERFIYEGSVMMFHEPYLNVIEAGNKNNLEDKQTLLKIISNHSVEIIYKNSKLKYDDVKSVMSRDSYLSAEDCLEYGLVDHIIQLPIYQNRFGDDEKINMTNLKIKKLADKVSCLTKEERLDLYNILDFDIRK